MGKKTMATVAPLDTWLWLNVLREREREREGGG